MKIKIIELRKNGYSVNDIAKELNCAKSTVSYHINKNGLGGKRDKFITSVDDSTIEHIRKLRIEEKTYSEILKIVDITEDKFQKLIEQYRMNKMACLKIYFGRV
jgi:predicted transcriptional regulator